MDGGESIRSGGGRRVEELVDGLTLRERVAACMAVRAQCHEVVGLVRPAAADLANVVDLKPDASITTLSAAVLTGKPVAFEHLPPQLNGLALARSPHRQCRQAVTAGTQVGFVDVAPDLPPFLVELAFGAATT